MWQKIAITYSIANENKSLIIHDSHILLGFY